MTTRSFKCRNCGAACTYPLTALPPGDGQLLICLCGGDLAAITDMPITVSLADAMAGRALHHIESPALDRIAAALERLTTLAESWTAERHGGNYVRICGPVTTYDGDSQDPDTR